MRWPLPWISWDNQVSGGFIPRQVPRAGGIAIWISFVAAVLLGGWLGLQQLGLGMEFLALEPLGLGLE